MTPGGQGIKWKKIGEVTLFVLFAVGFLGAMGWVEEQDEKARRKKTANVAVRPRSVIGKRNTSSTCSMTNIIGITEMICLYWGMTKILE